MTNHDKIDFIATLIEWNNNSVKFNFINTLLRSIDTEELIEIYWNSINNKLLSLTVVIQHQLVQRLIADKGEKLQSLIQQSLNEIRDNKHFESKKIRSLLTKSVEHLNNENKMIIFNFLRNDKMLVNRNLAYKSVTGIVDKNIDWKLIECWEKHHDYNSLRVLINETKFLNNVSEEFLLKIINSESLAPWVKRKALLALGQIDIKLIEFLKNGDPATYLYILSETKNEVDDDWIKDRLLHLSNLDHLNVFIHSIGQLNKFELLKSIHEQYDKIEKTVNKNFIESQSLTGTK